MPGAATGHLLPAAAAGWLLARLWSPEQFAFLATYGDELRTPDTRAALLRTLPETEARSYLALLDLPDPWVGVLALRTWHDRHDLLASRPAELLASGVAEALSPLPAALAGPLLTLTDLVKRYSQGRGYAGPPAIDLAHIQDLRVERVAELGWGDQVPETFVAGFLSESLSLRQREPWINELVRVMDVRPPAGPIRGLTPHEVATLVGSVADEDAEALGMVFAAVAEAVSLSPDEASQVAAEITEFAKPSADSAFGAAVEAIASCGVSPAVRAALVPPLFYLRNRLKAYGQQVHSDLVEHTMLAMLKC
ncbi:hypothetical protein [Fodinicola feengrottensis]|uniref:hypothetical protein n=1 Tax=Fodinicola feengrottensis TaxID=435914 RepID=UPI0013D4F17D|nr:hypothetical protein [Fodinicola feengrottensis]